GISLLKAGVYGRHGRELLRYAVLRRTRVRDACRDRRAVSLRGLPQLLEQHGGALPVAYVPGWHVADRVGIGESLRGLADGHRLLAQAMQQRGELFPGPGRGASGERARGG